MNWIKDNSFYLNFVSAILSASVAHAAHVLRNEGVYYFSGMSLFISFFGMLMAFISKMREGRRHG